MKRRNIADKTDRLINEWMRNFRPWERAMAFTALGMVIMMGLTSRRLARQRVGPGVGLPTELPPPPDVEP